MPSQQTVFKIFVASPGDVSDERTCLEDIVEEINKIHSNNLNARFELIKWETHTHPGFGEDGQDVINHQIDGNYDVFIGIMWTRFGTPTGRYESGTEEEFEIAFKKYVDNPAEIKLMFYFKDEKLNPSKINWDQYQKVIKFKEDIHEKGGLTRDFESTNDFKDLLRTNLSFLLNELQKGHQSKMHESSTQISKADSVDVEKMAVNFDEVQLDEEGLLDLLEIGEEKMNKSCDSLIRFTAIIKDFTENLTERTSALGSVKSPKDFKKAINLAAEDMEEMADRLNLEIPIYSDNFRQSCESFANAALLSIDFDLGEAEVKGSVISLEEMKTSIKFSEEQLQDFYESISNAPRITSSMNKSKRKTLLVLDVFLKEMTISKQLIDDVVDSFKTIL